jgi:hypothetical protein
VIGLTVVLCLGSSTLARVADLSLAELVKESELIVVARVIAVEDGPANTKRHNREYPSLKVATAQVLETWKGQAQREVQYVASPTWLCDTSYAAKGEKVVLFLTSWPGSRSFWIVHSGRGRMPTRDTEDKSLAEIPLDGVILPKNLPTIAESRKAEIPLPPTEPGKPRESWAVTYTVQWVDLGDLRRAVTAIDGRASGTPDP